MAWNSGQGRKPVSEMRCPQVWRVMTATFEMKGVSPYQRELVSVRAAPSECRCSYPRPTLPVPPPCSPGAFSTPARLHLPRQERQHPSLHFPAFGGAGSQLSLPGRASLLFLPPTKDPSGCISTPHPSVVSSALEGSKALFGYLLDTVNAQLHFLPCPFLSVLPARLTEETPA